MDKYYDLGGDFFVVRYERHDYFTRFKAWEVAGYGSKPLFGDDFEETFEQLTPFIEGSVKWDGCANFRFPGQSECMLHSCDRRDLTNIGVLLGRVFDQCVAVCDHSSELDDETESVVEDGPFPWKQEEIP